MTKSCVHRENYFCDARSAAEGDGHALCATPPNKKAGSAPAFSRLGCKPGSVFRSRRATPAKPVVHADLDGVFVVPEAPPGDVGRGNHEVVLAEIVILVLGLGRPVG